MSLAFDYFYTVMDGLKFVKITNARRNRIVAILGEIVRNTDHQSYECKLSAAEIATELDINPSIVSRELKFLEDDLKAIKRKSSPTHKAIYVTPFEAIENSSLFIWHKHSSPNVTKLRSHDVSRASVTTKITPTKSSNVVQFKSANGTKKMAMQ